ncbi:MAG: hypothetical protein ACR2PT_08395 [Endozoicomonas sp.]
MMTLNDELIQTWLAALNDSGDLVLSTTAEEYRMLRTFLAEAHSATRAWRQEPEEAEASRLREVQVKAWRNCHDWLLEALNKGQWSPEWLGWLAYSSLFTESPWMNLALSFKLLDGFFQNCPEQSEDYTAAVKRLGSILLDESGEPPILGPLVDAALVNGLSLTEVKKLDIDELSPDLDWICSSCDDLKSVKLILDKLPAYFQTVDQPAHIKKLAVSLNSCIDVLQHYIPAEVYGAYNESGTQMANPVEEITARESIQKQPVPLQAVEEGMSRERARTRLQELVAYFRQAEPHSPVSWQLEKALDWLDLSFPELLFKMTGERQDLHNEICRRAGLAELTDRITDNSAGNAPASVYSSSHKDSHREPLETNATTLKHGEPPELQIESHETPGKVLTQDLI